VYASPHVRELFHRAKVLPVTERPKFLAENKVTLLDDLWAVGSTVLEMVAECGWRQGRSAAEVLESKSLADLLDDEKLLRVALPDGMLQVLLGCFGKVFTTAISSTLEYVSEFMTAAFKEQTEASTPSHEGSGCKRRRTKTSEGSF
jgi:hypothetical protein